VKIHQLGIPGAFLAQPVKIPDNRGEFVVAFEQIAFRRAVGHPLPLAQMNCSRSVRGTIRGLHGIALPGQGRYMTCPAGAVIDIVVDARLGSPTYGEHITVELNEDNRHALYLAEGLLHGIAALTDGTTLVYPCTSSWSPHDAIYVNPLDPDLALPWPVDVPPVLSERDLLAPSLAEAERRGLLPTWEQCQARYAELAELTSGAA
jgi:dTDP-4-dehydrorhamnose 3,5-epimerase